MTLKTCNCPLLYTTSHKKFRNIALNCSFRNAQEKWSICNWMLKNMYKPDNSPSKVFIKWSRHHWLAYKIVDYLSSIFKTHSSFRSYNLRSTIVIRRSLRQPFLKGVYIETISRKVLAYGIYARVVDVLEIERVRFRLYKNNESVNTVQSTFHVLLCLLYTYWDIHHFASLLFQIFPES